MSRRTVLVALLTLGLPPTVGTAADRPNVLFILCDDIRWDCLGCAGHPYLKTPTSTGSPRKASTSPTPSARRRSARRAGRRS